MTEAANVEAPEATTPAEAKAQLRDMATNPETSKKLLDRDAQTFERYERLSQLAVQDSPTARVEAAMAGTLPTDGPQVLTGDSLSNRDLVSGIESLRNATVEDPQLHQFLTREPIKPEDRRFVEDYKRQLLGNREFMESFLAGDVDASKLMLTVNLQMTRPVMEGNQ